MLPPRVVAGICILVATLWALSTARDIVDDTYQPDPAINAVFGGVIGTALTLGKNSGEPKKPSKRGER